MSADRPGQWPIVFPHQQEAADDLAERYIAGIEKLVGADVDNYWVVCDEASGFWRVDWTWADGSKGTHRLAEVGW